MTTATLARSTGGQVVAAVVPVPGCSAAGPADLLPAEQVLQLLTTHPAFPTSVSGQRKQVRGAAVVLDWLGGHPGSGWQERWHNAGGDADTGWIDVFVADAPGTRAHKRAEVTAGLRCLILNRVLRPGYGFFRHYKPAVLIAEMIATTGADTFTRLRQAAVVMGVNDHQYHDARVTIAKMVFRTGRDVDQLTTADVDDYRASFNGRTRTVPTGTVLAWDLLREIGVLPTDSSMRQHLRRGPQATAELVDRYPIQSATIRHVLIRYLDERRPAVDYSTLRQLAATLAGIFWAEIERLHPGLETLHLPAEVAEAWKLGLLTITGTDGRVRERQSRFDVMGQVRTLYLDIAEWATEDAFWAAWAAPCPVRRGDTDGTSRKKQKNLAEMHQRVRERMPLLLDLVNAADTHRVFTEGLLTAASGAGMETEFVHNGVTYRRTRSDPRTRGGPDQVTALNLATGQKINATREEDSAFWAWAVIETLRHSGVRVEELLELTHLALISYQLPSTGEPVPLLQIVPSKTNEERLLLVSPELASVLACIISRLRRRHGGSVPLVARYDHYEAVTGPPLPHLFQRRWGTCQQVLSMHTVRELLNDTLKRTDLRDLAGRPLRYTPHDFRRIFTTEAVSNGLPVHIAAKILGHRNINTTQHYLVIFQEDLINTYRAFLDQRRAIRPAAEYREPTDEEWREFQQHFELRKVELGTCARPYGSPCRHEHSCIRCPVLRVDHNQRPRLIEIIRNLADRIAEAQRNGWHGEVQGLQVSLAEAEKKLVNLDRRAINSGSTLLGIPVIRDL
ncbi:site-specific integrase [Micromonospora sp. RTP1Z1]|uniref:tyrosine-type recombinase/integrase n=1 Tax=Micromonospora sp. RTP1Z1 TaxID=2994043 RepID=UPI0029C785CD|nr:site-specific integrase [Micromonospora sp. RTP1Z1]